MDKSFLFFHPNFIIQKKYPSYFFLASEASIGFHTVDKKMISGMGATYGGFFPAISNQTLENVIPALVQEIKDKDMEEVHIKLPPSYLLPSDQHTIWLKNGFTIVREDVNQHIEVLHPTIENYLNPQERRKLKQSVDIRIEVNSPSVSSEARFDLLEKARLFKSTPLTISKSEWSQFTQGLEDYYYFIDAFYGSTYIGMAIGVHLQPTVLYYYLPATHPDYISLSPSVKIIQHMYALAYELSCQYVDLGISNDASGLNEGLFRFKSNMGAKVSSKYTIMRKLQ